MRAMRRAASARLVQGVNMTTLRFITLQAHGAATPYADAGDGSTCPISSREWQNCKPCTAENGLARSLESAFSHYDSALASPAAGCRSCLRYFFRRAGAA